jgi:hypothetical protein
MVGAEWVVGQPNVAFCAIGDDLVMPSGPSSTIPVLSANVEIVVMSQYRNNCRISTLNYSFSQVR